LLHVRVFAFIDTVFQCWSVNSGGRRVVCPYEVMPTSTCTRRLTKAGLGSGSFVGFFSSVLVRFW
jgi:hypothetical protein